MKLTIIAALCVLFVGLLYFSAGIASESFVVRLATDQDRLDCEAISQAVYETVYQPLNIYTNNQAHNDEVNEWAFDKFYDQKMGRLLVAENRNKEVVGFIYAKHCLLLDEKGNVLQQIRDVLALPPDEQEARFDGSAVFVTFLYVDKHWQRKGIGKKLLQALPTYFPNLKTVALDSYVSHKEAIAYFHHLGFRKILQAKVLPELPEESVHFVMDANQLATF